MKTSNTGSKNTFSTRPISGFVALIVLSIISCSALAAQQASPYTAAARYNSAGQITGLIAPDPDGSGGLRYAATRNTYDSRGRLSKTETGELRDWLNETIAPKNWASYSTFTVLSSIRYTYDAYGRQRTETLVDRYNSKKQLTQYSYDNENRVQCKTVRMNAGAFASLPNSACSLGSTGSYGKDRISKYEYDSLDNITVEWRAWGSALKQKYVTRTYSGKRVTSMKDANGNLTRLDYDNYGRVLKRTYPSKTTAGSLNTGDYNQYRYDANGNVSWERKRNGAIITYTYDNTNQLTKKNVSGTSQDVYYRYDLRGLTLHSRFASHSGQGVINTFDGFGRVRQTTTTMGGRSRTLRYHYDKNSNRTRVYHPDNRYFSYRFDGLNRVTGVGESSSTSNILTVSYQANGARSYLSRYGGARTNYHYDSAQRLSSFNQNFSGSTNDLTNSFSYSPANQITRLTHSNDLYHYFGNNNKVGSYTANGLNQYTKVGSQTLTYDTNANVRTDGRFTYTYDSENRLIGTTGAKTASLKYDPLGRLFETVINGVRRQFLYDGDALVAEYTSSSTNSPTRRYVHGDQVDEPWVQYNGSSTGANYRRYLHADHQGSIIAHSNRYNNVLTTLSYDSYGIPGSENIDRFGYTGQIWLKELGLFHYKARLYSPQLGRFLQIDPIGYADQMNLYGYAYNDPINFIDPSGMANCAAGDSRCVETPESSQMPGEPEPKSGETQSIEEVVVTGHKNQTQNNIDFNISSEQFFVATGKSMSQRELKEKEVRCGKGVVAVVGRAKPLKGGQAAAHTHPNGVDGYPGPGDNIAAAQSSTRTAFVMTPGNVFTIEAMSNGTYRTTIASGGALSDTARAGLIANMQNWENPSKSSAKGKSDKERFCP